MGRASSHSEIPAWVNRNPVASHTAVPATSKGDSSESPPNLLGNEVFAHLTLVFGTRGGYNRVGCLVEML